MRLYVRLSSSRAVAQCSLTECSLNKLRTQVISHACSRLRVYERYLKRHVIPSRSMTSSATRQQKPELSPEVSPQLRHMKGRRMYRFRNCPRRLRTIARRLLRQLESDARPISTPYEQMHSGIEGKRITTNRTLPLVRRQRQGHRRPRRRRSPISTSPRRNLRRRAGRPLRRPPPPVRRDAELRQRAEPI